MLNFIYKIRNNWKKTIFFGLVGYYGSEYSHNRYKTFMMMREFGEEARTQGRKPLPRGARNKHVTIILNPAAGYRKGKENFEKYAEPLIHLAGFLVNVVKTEKISEARQLVELIDKTNIIGVAGGDGTLMEVVTGLLRREDANEAVERYPIALIPTGLHNATAHKIFSQKSNSPKEEAAFAAMNLVRHHLKAQDVIKIELITDKNESSEQHTIEPITDTINVTQTKNEKKQDPIISENSKPFYSMYGLQLGQFRESEKFEENMSRFLYKKFKTFWSLYRTHSVSCKVELHYKPFCEGCLNCKAEKKLKIKNQQKTSYFAKLMSSFQPTTVQAQQMERKWDRVNETCDSWESICVEACELNIMKKGNGKLEIQIGKNYANNLDFIKEGLNRKYKGKSGFNKRIICEEVELFPISTPLNFSIDYDEFPVKAIRMKVLRDKVYFFVPS